MSAYKSPGVFVKEVELPRPVTITGSPRVVGIVGKAETSYLVENAEVVKGVAGGSDTITGTVSGDVVSVVGVGSLPSLYDYTLTTDYTVSDNAISWAGAASEPTAGVTYYVTYYKLKSAAYYEPTTFYDINDVRAINGNELDNQEVNELTLAAYLAFLHGASSVVCVQQNGTGTAAEQAAIDKLESQEIDILLAPGMTSTTLKSYIVAHLNKMNSYTEKKERIWITSAQYLDDSVTTIKALAASLDNENVVVVAPPSCDIILSDGTCNIDSTMTVSGSYMGAALAGIMCNPAYDEAEPLTRKIISGFDDLGVTYKESEKNNLASSGVTVIDNENGTLRVRHALTTGDPNNVNKAELSVVSIKHQTIKDIRTALNAYVGTKYVTTKTNALIAAAVKSFCDQKVSDEIYVSYRNISVTQDTTDTRIARVHFEFKPVTTTTYVEITFGLYIS